MDGPSNYYAKGSNPEKANKWYCLSVESKKKECKLIYLQNRKRFTDSENKLIVTKEERGCGEGDKLGDWY